jgi:two-component system, NtrC family, response regulator AtoC
VFIADDDDRFRTTLSDALVAQGYEVIEASDGAQALEKLSMAADGQSVSPDVILLDVVMPGFSGLGVLSVMGRLSGHAPILLVTALADRSVDLFAARFGAHRVFRKPIDIEEVLESVLEAAKKGH